MRYSSVGIGLLFPGRLTSSHLLDRSKVEHQAFLPADPTEAAEVRTLRAANKRLAQELDILKKAIVLFSHPTTT